MSYKQRWEILKTLGEGGQGKVFLVRDRQDSELEKTRKTIIEAVREMVSNVSYENSTEKAFDTLRKAVENFRSQANSDNMAALKVLHEPKDARDPERADDRIKREMDAMSHASHNNLLCIRDTDPDGRWFAAQYHPNGTLSQRPELFKGDIPRALTAFRELVAGVATLHEKGIVHRDIKPQNIFLSVTDELVLGDFGLVFFTDERQTRLSDTLGNVGSRDWMPAWAMGIRIEDVKPSFDVFSLGKVLWSMVSGNQFLRLWYWNKPENDLEELFPQTPLIRLARGLFSKCIVEEEDDCLPNANELLCEVDKILQIIQRNGELLGDGVERYCRVCGVG